MFLTSIYRYNKILFFGICLFILAQLYVTYKRGMAMSPWYNYGMYSAAAPIQDTYTVIKVGELKGSDFSLQEWDKIHFTLQQFQVLSKNDALYTGEIRNFFLKRHISPPSKNLFTCDISEADFQKWYRHYLLTMINSRFSSVPSIDLQPVATCYRWNGYYLEFINSQPLISNH